MSGLWIIVVSYDRHVTLCRNSAPQIQNTCLFRFQLSCMSCLFPCESSDLPHLTPSHIPEPQSTLVLVLLLTNLLHKSAAIPAKQQHTHAGGTKNTPQGTMHKHTYMISGLSHAAVTSPSRYLFSYELNFFCLGHSLQQVTHCPDCLLFLHHLDTMDGVTSHDHVTIRGRLLSCDQSSQASQHSIDNTQKPNHRQYVMRSTFQTNPCPCRHP